jgi:aminopeptidase N
MCKIDFRIHVGKLIVAALLAFWPLSSGFGQEKFLPGEIHSQPEREPHLSGEMINPIDVLHYDVDLDIDMETKSILGKASLDIFWPDRSGDYFFLDLVGLKVDSMFINLVSIPVTVDDDRLLVDAKHWPVANDTNTVVVFYHGQPGNDGTGGFFFGDGIAFTLGEGLNSSPPSTLRYWVPSNDVPNDKATLDLKVTVPRQFTAVSNGTLIEKSEKAGRTTYHYRERHPIATYLMAISVSDYNFFSDYYVSLTNDTIPLSYYVWPNDLSKAKEDWKDVPKMMDFFERIFGAYPFDSYGMVEVPIHGAMEHQTMTSFANRLITGDHTYDYIVVHELAHQWWGDMVTLADWRDIWLNEGFASYCEALYIEHTQGVSALQDYMEAFKERYLSEVSQRGDFPIYDPVYLWGATVYQKGAWVLHTLRWTVGDSLFRRILREYGQTFSYSNANIQDFIHICEDVSGLDLQPFFDQWVFGAGMIELSASWDVTQVEDDQYQVRLLLQQTQRAETVFKFPLEIRFSVPSGEKSDTLFVNEQTQEFTFSLGERPLSLTLDPNHWLLAKIKFIEQPLPEGIAENQLALSQNYPNPYIPGEHTSGTKIIAQIVEKGAPLHVSLHIFDLLGRNVHTLVDKEMAAGLYTFSWDGIDDSGKKVPTGTYFFQLEAGGEKVRKKMTLIRN